MELVLGAVQQLVEHPLEFAIVVVLISGYLEVWVWGSAHRRLLKQEKEWRDIALEALETGERYHALERRRRSDE